MKLENLIRLSYGESDHIFSGHSYDTERAAKSLVKCNELGIGKQEFIDMHRAYLNSRNCSEAHITEQIKRVSDINYYFKRD
ncbi:hypothetical protein [Aquimarina pacifica]|uniref:hypothetical protein n=1 Tax=Aquimarina pacifica TaxID=1296415 RepID=UPI0004717CA8|nr:hypothetical protein [Aquimarina pacifica]